MDPWRAANVATCRLPLEVDEARAIAVSPRHTVLLAMELYPLIDKPPRQDFVVRTRARREANGLPLMAAELVIAGEETRADVIPPAATYPLHFRKTYFPGRLHGDPRDRVRAPPAGVASCARRRRRSDTAPNVFRSCLIPGPVRTRASRRSAASRPRTTSPRRRSCRWRPRRGCGGWPRRSLAQLLALHEGGLAHGDAELHNSSSARRRSSRS